LAFSADMVKRGTLLLIWIRAATLAAEKVLPPVCNRWYNPHVQQGEEDE
jgi:hypothetical protein